MNKPSAINRFYSWLRRIPCLIAVFIIKFYQAAISPLFPSCCRFIPTCSEYGLIAFQRFGFKKGFVLTAKRIMKCHPGGPRGYDPVPLSDPVPLTEKDGTSDNKERD